MVCPFAVGKAFGPFDFAQGRLLPMPPVRVAGVGPISRMWDKPNEFGGATPLSGERGRVHRAHDPYTFNSKK